MGYAARRNPTAQQASGGKLLSRQTIMGAMDHALEMHAAALRLLEARIVGLKERIELLEEVLKIKPPAPVVQVGAQAVTVTPRPPSAMPCGCDAGAGWTCALHQESAHVGTD